MNYTITSNKRDALMPVIQSWLDNPLLFCICVDRITGKGNARKQTQLGEPIERELLDSLGTADKVLDEVLESWGQDGGTLQVRSVFANDEGEPQWDRGNLRRSFPLTKMDGSSGEQKSGSDSAAAALGRSMAAVADNQGRRLEDMHGRLIGVTESMVDRVDRHGEQRFADVMALTAENSKLAIECAVLRMELAIAQQQRLPPEVWEGLLQHLPDVLDVAKTYIGAKMQATIAGATGPARTTADIRPKK